MNIFWVRNADAADRFYVEADAMRAEINSGRAGYEGKFNPYVGKFKAGLYVRKQIALELQYAMKGSDDDSGSHLELKNLYGGYLRLDSEVHNRVRIFLLGGYSKINLGITGPQSTVDDSKGDGFSWGIGIEDQVVRLRSTYFTVEYMKYYKKDGFNISGISAGFRVLF